MHDTRRINCHHIHSTGNRCGSPALRSEDFCFYHHPTRRSPRPRGRKPRLPVFHLPNVDDRNAVLRAVIKILSRVLSRRLERDKANALLHMLNLININLPGDPRSLSRLIAQAQADLSLPQFDPVPDILADLRELEGSCKKVTRSTPNTQ